MPISREDFEEIQKLAGTIGEAMQEIDQALRHADPRLYELIRLYGTVTR